MLGNIRTDDNDGYISDGLILRLDGIRNTRSGHATLLTAWENLVSHDNMLITGAVTVGDRSILFAETSHADGALSVSLSDFTVETVYRNVVNANDACTLGLFNGSRYEVLSGYFYFNHSNYYKNGRNMGINNAPSVASNVMTVSSTAGKATTYWNGALLDSVTDQITIKNISTCKINGTGNGQGSKEVFAIRLYTRLLNENEINANYQNDIARFGLNV